MVSSSVADGPLALEFSVSARGVLNLSKELFSLNNFSDNVLVSVEVVGFAERHHEFRSV